MIYELQKRPFVRLLGFWIIGILCYEYLHFSLWVSGLLLLFCFLSLFLFYIKGDDSFEAGVCYETRWVWGIIISVLIVSLSLLVAIYAENGFGFSFGLDGLKESALQARLSLVKAIDKLRLSDNEKSVLATLTLGYKQVLPYDIRADFSVTGVAHVLAVSGFHVGVVAGFLSFLFARIPVRVVRYELRYILTIGLVWGFVFITGLAASSVRAALMLSFYFIGRLIRKDSDSYNTLMAAAFCMLVYNPRYLFDVGFQLSYIAVFFILCLQPVFGKIIEVKNPVVGFLWRCLTVTLAAQVGTLFLCIYYFGYFSSVFMFTNVPVALFSIFLIPSALLWFCLPEYGFVNGWLQAIVETLTRMLLKVVKLFGSLPGAPVYIEFDILSLLCGYGVLVFLVLFFFKRRFWMLFASLFVLLILLIIRIR